MAIITWFVSGLFDRTSDHRSTEHRLLDARLWLSVFVGCISISYGGVAHSSLLQAVLAQCGESKRAQLFRGVVGQDRSALRSHHEWKANIVIVVTMSFDRRAVLFPRRLNQTTIWPELPQLFESHRWYLHETRQENRAREQTVEGLRKLEDGRCWVRQAQEHWNPRPCSKMSPEGRKNLTRRMLKVCNPVVKDTGAEDTD